MALSEEQIDSLSKELLKAEKDLKPIEPITDRFPEITIPEAYTIQLRSIKAKVGEGRIVVGKKIGLTSKAMQKYLKVQEADYGHILENMMIWEDQPIPMSMLIQPRLEAEICFILKDDLKGPGVTVGNVFNATAGLIPALEIIDSRIKDWKIKIQDAMSDNAGAALVVLGGKITPIEDLDPRLIGMMLEKDGEIIATAAGAAVLANPVQAVAWLANKLGEYGISLRAGEFIMAGSLISAVPVQAGSSFRATFDRLGSVSTRFVEEAGEKIEGRFW